MRSNTSLGINFGDKIRSGKDQVDTWKRMLQQIPTVSERIADSIVAQYPSCISFIRAVKRADKSNKHQFLVGLPILGGVGSKERSIGQIIAKRVVEAVIGNN